MDVFKKLMDVQEATTRWSLSAAQVKQHCSAGNIKAKKFGNSWVIIKDQPNPKQRARTNSIEKSEEV